MDIKPYLTLCSYQQREELLIPIGTHFCPLHFLTIPRGSLSITSSSRSYFIDFVYSFRSKICFPLYKARITLIATLVIGFNIGFLSIFPSFVKQIHVPFERYMDYILVAPSLLWNISTFPLQSLGSATVILSQSIYLKL